MPSQEQNKNILATLVDRVWIFLGEGKYAEAEGEYLAALAMEARNFSEDTLAIALAYQDGFIAKGSTSAEFTVEFLTYQDELGEAAEDLSMTLQTQDAIFGAQQASVFTDCHNLAIALGFRDNIRESLEFIRLAEEGRRVVLGVEHPHFKLSKRIRERIEAYSKEQQGQDSDLHADDV